MAEARSPVDIPPGAPVRRDGLELRYGSIPLRLGREPTAIHVENTGEMAAVIEGRANAGLTAVIAALDGDDPPATLDLRTLVPADQAYVAYDGSLTTPPFAEGVAWRMLIRPNTLSAAQLAALRTYHVGSARSVQPMGTRRFLSGAEQPARAS
jgi:carbonic anhydrase